MVHDCTFMPSCEKKISNKKAKHLIKIVLCSLIKVDRAGWELDGRLRAA